MVKRFLSVFLCFTVALVSSITAFSTNGCGTAEAAKVYETPYYYNQLDDETKDVYNTLKEAVMECDKIVKIKFKNGPDDDELQKLAELLIFHDPMTFNIDGIEAVLVTKKTVMFRLSYKYKKETYDKMTSAYEKKVKKVLDSFDEDMSTYTKIRKIHDYIINNTEYDLNSVYNENIYGTLVKKKGKCDGYAKTFSYICGQAGIRTVTVIGNDRSGNTDVMHMWNKVYYKNNWYNVDVTWDDPVGNYKNNLQYDFFMVSDDSMKYTHAEENFSFEVPEAENDSKDYFIVNKKYAEDFDSMKSILKKGLKSAAGKKKTCVYLKCSSEELFEKTKKYIKNNAKMHKFMSSVKKSTESSLVDDVYSYGFNENQYIVTLYVFYEDTDLEDYFLDRDALDKNTVKTLAKYGID